MATDREDFRTSVKSPSSSAAQNSSEEGGDKPVQIDGFHQVVEMLLAADPAFRESLLSRIARRDPRLAKSLREQIL